jgi:hypothetical protein
MPGELPPERPSDDARELWTPVDSERLDRERRQSYNQRQAESLDEVFDTLRQHSPEPTNDPNPPTKPSSTKPLVGPYQPGDSDADTETAP